MGLLAYAKNANYRRFYNDLKEISKENGKPAWLMFMDAGLCFARYRSGLQDYLNFRFYEKSAAERATYVTTGVEYEGFKILANPEKDPYFDKTNLFHMQPDLTRRDFCDPREGYEGFLEFVKRNPVFVSKPIYGLGGARVQKVDASTITDLHEYYEGLLERRDFVEELIVQDDQWGALSPGSINTLRVLTFALDGKAQVIYACARIGAGTAIVDNFHQGGKGVRIDTEKGCLVGNGISKKLEESELSVTGIRFDGFEIPYWDKVVEMVCKGAVNTPDMYLIGWDVALAKDGPLIIEANSGSGWDVTQVTALKGQKDLFDWMLDEVAKSKKA